ncbi:GNAT family N-acetyltransferase [Cohnella yongneupensis]|uniref:GNAT family N-acetyltransferase n=1 Tax=Cohnella yongneupensis TaxID=425006 RepID=A0ABW0QW11_9BACL
MDLGELFNRFPIFETERLVLRRLNLEDAPDYFEFASNPLVTAYTWWDYHQSLEESVQYIKQINEKYNNHAAFHWGIVIKEKNKIIGRTGFVSIDKYHERVEIGFALSSDYWNMGIVTEATKPLIGYGFDVLELNRIEARCNTENRGSERVMIKLGMKFEGIFREQLKVNGKYTDQKIYSILRKEYITN